ncbi:MAG: tetratricopeptide repeat protein, partial [Sphingobium limneticum]
MTAMRSARVEAARAALVRGDLDTAHRFATALVADARDDAEGHFLLGIAESSAGRVRAGIAHLSQAVSIDPRGEYRAHLAKLLILTREDGQAADMLRAAEQALPDDALGRDTMGCVYARLGDHAAALPHFDAATALDPDNAEYRYHQAATLNFLGRTDAADAALEALIARAP